MGRTRTTDVRRRGAILTRLALGTTGMSIASWAQYRNAKHDAKRATVREALLSEIDVRGSRLTAEVLKEAQDQVSAARQQLSELTDQTARDRTSSQRALKTELANEQANLARISRTIGHAGTSGP